VVFAKPVFSATPVAESGAYLGMTVGRANTDNPYTAYDVTMVETDTVGGIFLGYQFNKNWGTEAFYANVGKVAGNNVAGTSTGSVSAHALGMNVVGTLPLTDNFSIYGKLGFGSTKTSAASTPAGLTGRNHNQVMSGLGGQFSVNKKFGIRIGADSYKLSTLSGNTAGVEDKFRTTVWSVGGLFRF
jgi:OOP family OmpA-OmpF porin